MHRTNYIACADVSCSPLFAFCQTNNEIAFPLALLNVLKCSHNQHIPRTRCNFFRSTFYVVFLLLLLLFSIASSSVYDYNILISSDLTKKKKFTNKNNILFESLKLLDASVFVCGFFFCFIFMSFRLDFSGCRALLFLSLCTRWPKHYYLFISVLLTVKWKQLLLSALRWQARTWLDLCAQVVSTVQKTENNHKFELLESAASTTRCFSYLGETNALEHNCKHCCCLFVCLP